MKILIFHQHYLMPGAGGGSRFNEFAYWRSMEAKMAETLPRPGTVAEASLLGGQMTEDRGRMTENQ